MVAFKLKQVLPVVKGSRAADEAATETAFLLTTADASGFVKHDVILLMTLFTTRLIKKLSDRCSFN